MMHRLLSPAADPGTPPEKFEEMLERLEKIVADMENGEMPLEKLLSSYEEGMWLVKACGSRLSDAEQKVEILSRSAASETSKPVPPPLPTEEKPAETSDDIRLF